MGARSQYCPVVTLTLVFTQQPCFSIAVWGLCTPVILQLCPCGAICDPVLPCGGLDSPADTGCFQALIHVVKGTLVLMPAMSHVP